MNILSRFMSRVAMVTGLTWTALAVVGTTEAKAQYYNDPYSNNSYGNYGNDDYDYNSQYGYNDNYNYNTNDYLAFYSDLAPHGQWFRDPRYGMVWAPRVAANFVPYQTNGYWAMTQYGNTWMSSYSWGWAAFHYGRWSFDPYYGWIWLPGRQWGPAWVSWRQGGGYYGWAPLGPGMNYNMGFGYGGGRFNPWTFVPYNNIYHRGGYNKYVRNNNMSALYQQTGQINNYRNQNGSNYVLGPSKGDVESAVRRTVPVYNLEDRGSKGNATVSGSRITMYRPDVQSVSRSAAQVDTRSVQSIDLRNNATRNTGGVRSTNTNTRTNVRGSNATETRTGTPASSGAGRNTRTTTNTRTTNTPSVERTNQPRSTTPANSNSNRVQRTTPQVDRSNSNQRTSVERSAPARTSTNTESRTTGGGRR